MSYAIYASEEPPFFRGLMAEILGSIAWVREEANGGCSPQLKVGEPASLKRERGLGSSVLVFSSHLGDLPVIEDPKGRKFSLHTNHPKNRAEIFPTKGAFPPPEFHFKTGGPCVCISHPLHELLQISPPLSFTHPITPHAAPEKRAIIA